VAPDDGSLAQEWVVDSTYRNLGPSVIKWASKRKAAILGGIIM